MLNDYREGIWSRRNLEKLLIDPLERRAMRYRGFSAYESIHFVGWIIFVVEINHGPRTVLRCTQLAVCRRCQSVINSSAAPYGNETDIKLWPIVCLIVRAKLNLGNLKFETGRTEYAKPDTNTRPGKYCDLLFPFPSTNTECKVPRGLTCYVTITKHFSSLMDRIWESLTFLPCNYRAHFSNSTRDPLLNFNCCS